MDAIKTLEKYEARSMHGQLPVVWEKAKDAYVWDNKGKKYIDFTSGICVANAGHSNPAICNAIRKQANQGLLHSYTFPTEIRAKFIKKLVETCYPGGKAFLLSAGTEATECACKLMMMKRNNGYIVSFKGAMHGRTMLAEQLKGRTADNSWAFPDCWDEYPQLLYLDWEKQDTYYKKWNNHFPLTSVAGIIIESYQGWSAKFYPKKYIQDLVNWAQTNDILVCFDEIQGGFGRTGKMFAYEHYGVNPDLVCLGKGISSSVPLSAVVGRADILDIPETGSMSSTHSANPLSCAVGLANLLEIKKLVNSVELHKCEFLLQQFLDKIPYETYGKGLLGAIITETPEIASKFVHLAAERGLLLIKTGKPSIKIAPPLNITHQVMLEGLRTLEEILTNGL